MRDSGEPVTGEQAVLAADDTVEGGSYAPPRLGSSAGGLRERAAKGLLVNAGFQIVFAALTLLQRFAVATFLTLSEFGIWGLVLTTLITLSGLKQIGISDKYVQQEESDQELAFQKAFTLELVYTLIFCAFLAVVLPLYGLVYGRSEIVLPSMVLALALIGTALQSPQWIPYRQMRYARQRILEGVNPVVSTAVMVPLAAAGAGYWSLVFGVLAGSFAAAAAACIASPYRLALRFDRGTLRDYFRFSWPVLLATGSGLLVVQGTMLIGNYTVGLVGVGALTLASSLLVFADRVDSIVSRTIYPAVCAVKTRTDLLFEVFTKSNRLALMWGLSFGVGLLLFAPDLVRFVLGERWQPAVGLLQVLGLVVGLRQLGFNWNLFFQAVGDTRPLAVSGAAALAVFVAATAPLMVAFGLTGFMIGMGVSVVTQLSLRAWYLSRLFARFDPLRHMLRAFVPSVPAVAAVLAARLVYGGGRTFGVALTEFALYVVVTVVATLYFERALLHEVLGYLGRGRERNLSSAGEHRTAPT